jgi:hypothetical protein
MPASADHTLDAGTSTLGWLDPSPNRRRWTAWETIALLLYCAVAAFGIHQHIPWADESQAWMLAQEVSLPTLLVHSLHYEGTPGLWHVLLQLLQAFHFSFTAGRWVAGGIAAAGAAVLLGFAPFPRIVRLLLPFSFFLAYQDAIIARSYVLFAVFAFTAAAVLRSAEARPIRMALVLGLMANISLHALIASGGLATVAALLWRHRLPGRRRLIALLLLALFWAGAVASMVPMRDVDFSAGNNVWRSLAKVENDLGIHAVAPPAITSLDMAGLPRSPLPVHVREAGAKTWHKAARTLAVLTYPLSSWRWLALLLVALVSAQACSRVKGVVHGRSSIDTCSGGIDSIEMGPMALLPYLLMVAVFTSLYLEPRHAGMVFTVFVVSAWLSWPSWPSWPGPTVRPAPTLSQHTLPRLTAAVFAVVLAQQIGWTFHALRSEHTLIYSPDQLTAEYLREHLDQDATSPQAAGFYYYSTGPLLYFNHNLYFNQPAHRYWSWSTQMRSEATVEQVLAQHPRLIIIGGDESGPDAEITRDWLPNTPPERGVRLKDVFFVSDYFLHHGYRETHLFCGHSWMRASYAERICDSVLEPTSHP